jgi:transposase
MNDTKAQQWVIKNPNAAGIDVGAESHFVAVAPQSSTQPVREFSAFTHGLHELSAWLKTCGVKTVAMESTGVYWIPLFELLEQEGFEVRLVDAHHVKNVSGRKSDVLDCQWIQQLHSFGLLSAAFRPEESICILRSYMRQRALLIAQAAEQIQRMQKALTQMNLKLQHVVSDISGDTGMRILRAILNGERNGRNLAKLRDQRCHKTEAEIAAALQGSYRAEHLFTLKQALDLYDFLHAQIAACDQQIEVEVKRFSDRSNGGTPPPNGKPNRRRGNAPNFELRTSLFQMLGVDLTAVPGLDALSVAKIVSEIGTDMSKWKTVNHFCSWLNACPGTRISGGRRLGGRSKRSGNRSLQVFRIAAQTLTKSKSALGALYRSMRARWGGLFANKVLAHKLARIVYTIIKTCTPFKVETEDEYLEQRRIRQLSTLKKRANALGFQLVPVGS